MAYSQSIKHFPIAMTHANSQIPRVNGRSTKRTPSVVQNDDENVQVHDECSVKVTKIDPVTHNEQEFRKDVLDKLLYCICMTRAYSQADHQAGFSL